MMSKGMEVKANCESNNITQRLSELEDQQMSMGGGMAQILYLLTGNTPVAKPIESIDGIQGRVDRLRNVNKDLIEMIGTILEVL